jgi:hypothetical protein
MRRSDGSSPTASSVAYRSEGSTTLAARLTADFALALGAVLGQGFGALTVAVTATPSGALSGAGAGRAIRYSGQRGIAFTGHPLSQHATNRRTGHRHRDRRTGAPRVSAL